MADSTDEPLMRHEPEADYDTTVDVDLFDVSLLLEKNLRHPGLFVWLLTFSAGISGLLFGCMYIPVGKGKKMLTKMGR
jgi:SP family myo-inositol transporter-like MFS transporter 13